MTEPGIGSIAEFLFVYITVGFAIGLFWLGVDDPLGDAERTDSRPAGIRHRPGVARALSVLGLLHLGFGLLALDASRVHADAGARRRAALQAWASTALGFVAMVGAVAFGPWD